MSAFLFAVLAGALAAMPVAAQNRSNFAWWNSEVVHDLHLSEAQHAQIHQIVSSYRDKLIDARAAVQKAEGDLQDILNSEHLDPTQAEPTVEKLANARAESTRVFTRMSLQLRAVLTLDQWRELVRRWGSLQKGQRPTDTQVQP
jgi:Spy/CpxP family protein refolding chaperone